MLEKIAKYVHHEMWVKWAKILLNQEKDITKERVERWNKDFIEYDDLSEEKKDIDRKFAKEILKIVDASVKDRYLDMTKSVKRLVAEYQRHGNLYVAFDFDSTVYDVHELGDTYPKMEALLRFLKLKGFKLILFTCNEGEKLDFRVKYCKDHGFEPDMINSNPIMKTNKPFYSILLDDRAGLNEAYQIMKLTLNTLNFNFQEN